MVSNPHGVWAQMNYVPPRGQCNFKQSVLSPKCPCLRFMLHPLKSTSSFECDGCTHHASFHSMENKAEDEVRKRWEQDAKERQEREESLAVRPRKRMRELEYSGEGSAGSVRLIESGIVTLDASTTGSESGSSRAKAKGRKKATAAPSARPTRGRGRVSEITGEDEEYIELD